MLLHPVLLLYQQVWCRIGSYKCSETWAGELYGGQRQLKDRVNHRRAFPCTMCREVFRGSELLWADSVPLQPPNTYCRGSLQNVQVLSGAVSELWVSVKHWLPFSESLCRSLPFFNSFVSLCFREIGELPVSLASLETEVRLELESLGLLWVVGRTCCHLWQDMGMPITSCRLSIACWFLLWTWLSYFIHSVKVQMADRYTNWHCPDACASIIRSC